MTKLKKQLGFTLAELLVALLILGVIATFSIPKILDSQQNTQRKAVFKELITTVQLVYTEQYLVASGSLNDTTNFPTILINRLNALKVCPINAESQGCRSTYMDGLGGVPGVLMPNGAVITTFIGDANDIIIDWNGDNLPNKIGEDILHLVGFFKGSIWHQNFGETGALGINHSGKLAAPNGGIGWPHETENFLLYQKLMEP